jgi:hypothetical protein
VARSVSAAMTRQWPLLALVCAASGMMFGVAVGFWTLISLALLGSAAAVLCGDEQAGRATWGKLVSQAPALALIAGRELRRPIHEPLMVGPALYVPDRGELLFGLAILALGVALASFDFRPGGVLDSATSRRGSRLVIALAAVGAAGSACLGFMYASRASWDGYAGAQPVVGSLAAAAAEPCVETLHTSGHLKETPEKGESCATEEREVDDLLFHYHCHWAGAISPGQRPGWCSLYVRRPDESERHLWSASIDAAVTVRRDGAETSFVMNGEVVRVLDRKGRQVFDFLPPIRRVAPPLAWASVGAAAGAASALLLAVSLGRGLEGGASRWWRHLAVALAGISALAIAPMIAFGALFVGAP